MKQLDRTDDYASQLDLLTSGPDHGDRRRRGHGAIEPWRRFCTAWAGMLAGGNPPDLMAGEPKDAQLKIPATWTKISTLVAQAFGKYAAQANRSGSTER